MLDEPPGRKLILKKETAFDLVKEIWAIGHPEGRRRFLGIHAITWLFVFLGQPLMECCLSPGEWDGGWKLNLSWSSVKTFLHNSFVMVSAGQGESTTEVEVPLLCGTQWFGGLRTPEDTLWKLQDVNILVPTEFRARRWCSREVAAVLSGNQRNQRAHRRTPWMGLSRREVEEK